MLDPIKLDPIKLPLIASVTLVALGAAPRLAAASEGAVYAMTNDLFDNEIAVYTRDDDGTLALDGYVSTGGRGVGDTTEPVDALGSQAPLVLDPDGRWLLAVNASSNEVSVFRVHDDGLELRSVTPSGGLHPASLAIHGSRVYVLNSGGEGNVTAFRLLPNGNLAPMPGSTRALGVGGTNPPSFIVSPAQIGVDPTGNVLVVSIKGTDELRSFPLGPDGMPSMVPEITPSSGSTPFGFAFDDAGHLVVAEPFGPASPGVGGASAASTYEVQADGTLELVSATVENFQTASCWLVTDGQHVFTTNNATDTITSYALDDQGELTLLAPGGVAASTGVAPVDLALSPDGRFLYDVNAGDGTISAFRVEPDGSLTALGVVGGLPADHGAVGIAVR
ncbi:MAG: beta-propeller fold lactonase family protein [Myxococcales bacterium]|nr:beta-propeller fold lactonase family protein [Myxococcales bacterium]